MLYRLKMVWNGGDRNCMHVFFLCSKSAVSLRRLLKRFGWICKEKGINVKVDMSKWIVVGEECLKCEILLSGRQLEQLSNGRYMGFMLNEKGMADEKCSRKV